MIKKTAFEAENPINWDSDKYYICNFPIKTNAKGPNVPNPEMSYTDFYIRQEKKIGDFRSVKNFGKLLQSI